MGLAAIPNAITVMRIVLVFPTAWFLWRTQYVDALIVMAIAGASDAVDGWLARRWNAVSRFGSAVDPMADKLLVAATFVVFAIQGHLPLWLVLVVIGRDVVIIGGASVYRLLFGTIEFAPTLLSKANTALQIGVLLLVLVVLCDFDGLNAYLQPIVDPWSFWLLAFLAVVSGLDYVITWGLRAIRESRARRADAG
jgi:cardiolipin synthase